MLALTVMVISMPVPMSMPMPMLLMPMTKVPCIPIPVRNMGDTPAIPYELKGNQLFDCVVSGKEKRLVVVCVFHGCAQVVCNLVNPSTNLAVYVHAVCT